jgi:hypothetical protein
MNGTRFWPVLAWLALGSASAAAADLAKIDRRIVREPAYQSGEPKYCLVVFGPEARTRVMPSPMPSPMPDGAGQRPGNRATGPAHFSQWDRPGSTTPVPDLAPTHC